LLGKTATASNEYRIKCFRKDKQKQGLSKMKSKIARRIYEETPMPVKNKVRQLSDKRLILLEVWQKWCELDYEAFDAWLHKSMNHEDKATEGKRTGKGFSV
jgi:hypothetical protein